MSGKTTVEIAAQLEISPKQVTDAINARMKMETSLISADQRTGLVQLQMDRYSQVLKAHWTAMELGDPKSSEIVLKTLAEINKLNHLGELDPQNDKMQVLVVAGDEASYIKALMSASE